MKAVVFGIALSGIAFALPVHAQTSAPQTKAPAATPASTEPYDGQIKRINREAGRVTIAHGPLKGLDMPAMTMAFPVKDTRQLASLKEGDKVRFSLERSGENLVVTRIEPAK